MATSFFPWTVREHLRIFYNLHLSLDFHFLAVRVINLIVVVWVGAGLGLGQSARVNTVDRHQ